MELLDLGVFQHALPLLKVELLQAAILNKVFFGFVNSELRKSRGFFGFCFFKFVD